MTHVATRAKFRCNKVEAYGQSQKVSLSAVCADTMGDTEENKSFTKWTPWGELNMTVDNPRAAVVFEEGAVYYLDISRAEV